MKLSKATDKPLRLIHEAAVNPNQWNNALSEIELYLGVEAVNLVMVREETPSIANFLSSSIPEETLSDYQKRFSAGDVWIESLKKHPPYTLHRSGQLYPNRTLVQTEFYEEFLKPIGLFHCAGGFFESKNGNLGMMSALLPEREGELDNKRLKKMALVNQHLRKALHTSSAISALKASHDLVAQATAHQNLALALINTQLKLVYMNGAFQNLLGKKTLCTCRNDRVGFIDQTCQFWFGKQLKRFSRPGKNTQQSTQIPLTAEYAVWPYSITVAEVSPPCDLNLGPKDTFIMLTIRCEPAREQVIQRLKQVGAPPATALLAFELLEGKSLRQASESLKISYETARSQAKKLFRIFKVNNQRQLMTLLNFIIAQ